MVVLKKFEDVYEEFTEAKNLWVHNLISYTSVLQKALTFMAFQMRHLYLKNFYSKKY